MENLKPIYNQFKKELQGYIKEVAEKNGIDPVEAIKLISEPIQNSNNDDVIDGIAARYKHDYGIAHDDVYGFFFGFMTEIYEAICPDWNSTIKDVSITTYLNRRLKEEGYDTVPCEALDFLIDEIQKMKPVEDGESL